MEKFTKKEILLNGLVWLGFLIVLLLILNLFRIESYDSEKFITIKTNWLFTKTSVNFYENDYGFLNLNSKSCLCNSKVDKETLDNEGFLYGKGARCECLVPDKKHKIVFRGFT